MNDMTENKNAGTITVTQGKNPCTPYEHQIDAMRSLSTLDRRESFSTMIVLPTGGGKTKTAVSWILSNAVNRGVKVLWIAHRHLLLEQAASAFISNAYADSLSDIVNFNYRIVSGKHDKPVHIQSSDNVLIASKDSLIRNLEILDNWLSGDKELYLVIDEAHHATAKSYRRIIEHIREEVPKLKIIGLTATPMRTSEDEQGLLGQIFTDDIAYKIDLKELISRRILSIPITKLRETNVNFGEKLGQKDVKRIINLDLIPEDIAEFLAENKERNRIIVDEYLSHSSEYGQTIVFAQNRNHAIALRALFCDAGIKADVVISGTQDFIGIDVSSTFNKKAIEQFSTGDIQVLINVNILTEGADLPNTKTVFLARPTVSTVLMTQMIGRALRGERAGGTKEAYIVSFVDDWQEKVAWVNPDTVIDEEKDFQDKSSEYKKRQIHLISIEKLEEFARIANAAVPTDLLEAVPYSQRIPLGMYVFSYIDDNQAEKNYRILVYNNSMSKYEELIAALPEAFTERSLCEENLTEEQLSELCNIAESTYFDNDMLPPYNRIDIENLLKYYAQKGCRPLFVPLDELDRRKVDLSEFAKHIVDTEMSRQEQKKYTDELWNDENSLVRVYFQRKGYFKQQLEIEIDKALGDFETYSPKKPESEIRKPEDMTLFKIRNSFPELYKEYRNGVFLKASTTEGKYRCAICGKTSDKKMLFQIDHIYPMAKGGKTVPENLQLLCYSCNLRKSDKV